MKHMIVGSRTKIDRNVKSPWFAKYESIPCKVFGLGDWSI